MDLWSHVIKYSIQILQQVLQVPSVQSEAQLCGIYPW